MCGIAGFFRPGFDLGSVTSAGPAGSAGPHRAHFASSSDPSDRAALAAMVDALSHRGPDGRGLLLAGPFALGHARLAILDLAGGRQPIWNEDRTAAVVVNGEIYNYRELRRGLEQRGHRFATDSDCEVVVHLYEEEGEACVARLRGMFALALADLKRRRLLLARDRLGKKPLYITEGAGPGHRIGFASELKALTAGGLLASDIDPEAVDLYLTLGYVPCPWTIFRGARKLAPGHYAVCDAAGLRTVRYWDLEFAPPGEADAAAEAGLEELIDEAVRLRLASDVPLGAFLSGGIDSGTVVSFMAAAMDLPVATHTVGFDDPALDERPDAAAVARALGTDHQETAVHPELADLLPKIAWHLDEPFADPSAVPTWYVSQETRRRVTVALSGDGGDELFAGYVDRYAMHLAEDRLRPWIPGPLRRLALPALARQWPRSPRVPRALRLGGLFENLSLDSDRAYLRDQSVLPPHVRARLGGTAAAPGFEPFAALAPHFERAPEGDPLARALYLDVKTWLADGILVKVDRMSMAHALEVRCPLLDHRVAELAARLPSAAKLAGGRGKLPLRRLAARRLPAEILERPKRGFLPPVSRWLRHDL
ncbi:MAG TPA: asparagine synthase (glutamine-hydrolyzing), partial [Thermoanaerobaculia bacterium]|nr:asparagine synthase (glutamine-hydrolyzing) [Thermoanaerobaculia bacterium]